MGLCEACIHELGITADASLLDSIESPVLLMQGNPRQVITANRHALGLFNKGMAEVAQHRGGQVFDCVHSFTELGCGKDPNCEHCKIKEAIVSTFDTGIPHDRVTTHLSVRKGETVKTYTLQVTTRKAGDLALVRIDRYETDD